MRLGQLLRCILVLSSVHLQHAWKWNRRHVPAFSWRRGALTSVLSSLLSLGPSVSPWLAQTNGSPYLAVITEPDSCDTKERTQAALEAIASAVSTQQVYLVSVRINKAPGVSQEEMDARVKELTAKIMDLKSNNTFHLVVSSDWVETIEASWEVGVHVKENHRSKIPAIRDRLGKGVLIGTSAHSIESALDAVSKYDPDYMFVGTCYATTSHPEKEAADLEGPALPGDVRRAIRAIKIDASPIVLAIGGIDETNCHEPVLKFGADGVAVIRAVLQAPNPADAVLRIRASLQKSREEQLGVGTKT
jgi:thiamine-phosphate diphosphorylase